MGGMLRPDSEDSWMLSKTACSVTYRLRNEGFDQKSDINSHDPVPVKLDL